LGLQLAQNSRRFRFGRWQAPPDGAVDVNKEREMNREAIRDRVRDHMEEDFLPEPSADTLSQFDRRMVNAVEYVAYHLGAIDKKLARLIALLEASASKT
jgi:hypothetical protein